MSLDDAQPRLTASCCRHANDQAHPVKQVRPRLALGRIVAADETEASRHAAAETVAFDAQFPILQRAQQGVGRSFGEQVAGLDK